MNTQAKYIYVSVSGLITYTSFESQAWIAPSATFPRFIYALLVYYQSYILAT